MAKSTEELQAEEDAAVERAERGAQAEPNEPGTPDVVVPDERTIHQRMIAILEELPAIGKTQRNEQQGFNFRGHDDVLNALTPLLAEHGVVIVPNVVERETSQRTTRSGSIMYEVNLHVEFTCYGAMGDHVTGSAWGEGTDSGDKSTMKAGTMAFKAFLNQTFAINTEEASKHDADKSTPEETVREDVRVEPEVKAPQTWAEALRRFDGLMARNGEGQAWLAELVEVRFGATTLGDLTAAQKRQALIGFSSAMMLLEERHGDLSLTPGVRQIIAGAFAEKNEGLKLEGPAWPLDGNEAEERGEQVGWRSAEEAAAEAAAEEPPSPDSAG